MTRDRTLMAVAFAVTALGVSSVSLLAPVLPELADRYQVGVQQLAYFQMAVMLPGIVTGVLAARLARALGKRFALVACLAVFGAAGVSLVLVTSFPLAVALRLVQGVGGGGLVALSFLLAGSVAPERRVRAVGYNAAVVSITMVLAPLVGSTLGGYSSLAPFAWYGLALPAAVVVWRVLPGAAASATPEATPTASPASRRAPSAEVVGILAMTVALNVLVFGWFLLLTPLLLDANGVDLTWRGWALAVQSALATVATFATGRWRARERYAVLMTLGWGIGFVFVAGAGLAPGGLGIAALIGAGICYGILNPVLAARIAVVDRGHWFGWWQSCARTGQVLGPVVAGWLIVGLPISAVFVVGGTLSAVVAVVVAVRAVRR
ncbi:MFS transporter [Ruania halotolerans]|uniref:MFS transporter n=1 Tax=Ruania halotolerans TaxID=2897773 RepID=UPI001E3E7120|nr:MFS transporter [Ruania halotolerans]UFU07985.1 MFS transporter [Ruania halotolerans]